MTSTLRACAALLVVALVPAQATATQTLCPGFAEGNASPGAVDRFYVARAVTIVRAGLAADTATLATLVSPDAAFATWRGDYAIGGRETGVAGTVAWARDLNPSRFESSIDQRGPISVATPNCRQTARILFGTRDAGTGVNVTFEFLDGLLVRATGREVILVEGEIR
ncbi:hypothetical protein U1769_19355 [Sphingomonas sp. ZT3P38]|uniref:hypothetical protein n=1 Tax=Parasphingomonas zepuensis TaxID=3096161 RepID=UPI002FC64629